MKFLLQQEAAFGRAHHAPEGGRTAVPNRGQDLILESGSGVKFPLWQEWFGRAHQAWNSSSMARPRIEAAWDAARLSSSRLEIRVLVNI